MTDKLLTQDLFARACEIATGAPLPADLSIEISHHGNAAVLHGPAGSSKNELARLVLQAIPADRRGEVSITTISADGTVREFRGRAG
ncbi:MAG: hypothetical protein ACT6TH_14610 [Brevundimonas sp.]|uniref:hypothetical protein n=1 Tax=Brevundimonas sp. TaxID=1871086 RepID=UPI0040334EE5